MVGSSGESQQGALHRFRQLDEFVELLLLHRPEQHQFMVGHLIMVLKQPRINVRVMLEDLLTARRRHERDVVALALEFGQQVGRLDRVAKATVTHHAGRFGRAFLQHHQLQRIVALAEHLKEAVFPVLIADLLHQQVKAANFGHVVVDVGLGEVVLVVWVGAKRADVRVQRLVRQVQHQMATDLEFLPPLRQCRPRVLDVFQQVTGKHKVQCAVVHEIQLGRIVADHIGLDLGVEQFGVLAIVDTDEVRESLVRPTAQVNALAAGVLDNLVLDLVGLAALGVVDVPGHGLVQSPLLQRVSSMG